LLRNAYRLFVSSKRVEEIVAEAIADIESENIATPSNLGARVASHLRRHPKLRWDQAVAAIAEEDQNEGDDL
jgi:hypothetical protein